VLSFDVVVVVVRPDAVVPWVAVALVVVFELALVDVVSDTANLLLAVVGLLASEAVVVTAAMKAFWELVVAACPLICPCCIPNTMVLCTEGP